MTAARLLLAAALLAGSPAMATDILDDWATVTIPAPPPLQPIQADPSTTSLLVLDFDSNSCNPQKRARCFATIPATANLLAAARAHNATIAYSTTPTGRIEDTPASLAPRPGEPVVRAGADKFFGTDLADTLKSRNIHTVIVTGTIANGAVLYTASAAALRGFNVVIPIDTMSSDSAFADLATAWSLVHGPASVSTHITLTRSTLIAW